MRFNRYLYAILLELVQLDLRQRIKTEWIDIENRETLYYNNLTDWL